jgi:hypothetical protein
LIKVILAQHLGIQPRIAAVIIARAIEIVVVHVDVTETICGHALFAQCAPPVVMECNVTGGRVGVRGTDQVDEVMSVVAGVIEFAPGNGNVGGAGAMVETTIGAVEYGAFGDKDISRVIERAFNRGAGTRAMDRLVALDVDAATRAEINGAGHVDVASGRGLGELLQLRGRGNRDGGAARAASGIPAETIGSLTRKTSQRDQGEEWKSARILQDGFDWAHSVSSEL